MGHGWGRNSKRQHRASLDKWLKECLRVNAKRDEMAQSNQSLENDARAPGGKGNEVEPA